MAPFPRQPRLFEMPSSTSSSSASGFAAATFTPLDDSGSGGTGSGESTTVGQATQAQAQAQAGGLEHCLLTVGEGPTLGLYRVGGGGGRYRGLAELVSAVRQRITRAVVGTVGTLLPLALAPGLGLLRHALPLRFGGGEAEEHGGGSGGGLGGEEDPFAPAAIRWVIGVWSRRVPICLSVRTGGPSVCCELRDDNMRTLYYTNDQTI